MLHTFYVDLFLDLIIQTILLTSYALCYVHSTGDCDSDIDCKDGYVCHQRDEWEEVYGCVGWGEYGLDYCREVRDEEEIRSLLI